MANRTEVALRRCGYAFCVLVLMPVATFKTLEHPGPIQVALWCFSAAWTALAGKLYRRSAAKIAQGGSDDWP